jgi:hypothetical protein
MVESNRLSFLTSPDGKKDKKASRGRFIPAKRGGASFSLKLLENLYYSLANF